MTEIIVDESYVQVTDSESIIDISIVEQNNVVEIASVGPQGPQGIQGPAGAPGAPGASTLEQIAYVHEQLSASSTWTIVHTLNFKPNITVVDSAGTAVEGEYSYPNLTTVIAQFSAAFAGKAYLS